MRPDSFKKAMIEPVKVTAPMATPSDISTRLAVWIGARRADAEGFRRIKAAAATSTAARPTSEWKAATSSGIAVIGMRRAITAPMPPPIQPPKIIAQVSPVSGLATASVVSTAIAMPVMPR